MESLRKNVWRIVLIVLASTVVDILLHRLIPVTLAAPLPASLIVEQSWMLPAAGSALVLTFAAMATVFALIQEKLPGAGLSKGLYYGIAFSGLWLLGFVETAVVFGAPITAELRNWIPDGITVLLLGALLGSFTATGRPSTGERARPRLVPFLAVALAYLVGRYLAYGVLQTNTAYGPDPTAEFLWTAGMAVWMGLMYAALAPGSRDSTPLARALNYGLLVIGVNWVIFHLFALVFYDLPALQVGLVRPGVDALFITAGAFAAGLLQERARPGQLPCYWYRSDR